MTMYKVCYLRKYQVQLGIKRTKSMTMDSRDSCVIKFSTHSFLQRFVRIKPGVGRDFFTHSVYLSAA